MRWKVASTQSSMSRVQVWESTSPKKFGVSKNIVGKTVYQSPFSTKQKWQFCSLVQPLFRAIGLYQRYSISSAFHLRSGSYAYVLGDQEIRSLAGQNFLQKNPSITPIFGNLNAHPTFLTACLCSISLQIKLFNFILPLTK